MNKYRVIGNAFYKERMMRTQMLIQKACKICLLFVSLVFFLHYLHHSQLGVFIWNAPSGASLVAQWLRICLTMQGTQVRALVREDPTCRGATKPVHHNYWACVLEPASHNYWAHVPQLLKPARLEPVLRNKRSHCNEKPMHCNEE